LWHYASTYDIMNLYGLLSDRQGGIHFWGRAYEVDSTTSHMWMLVRIMASGGDL